jgi:hypothetical protein
MPDLHTRVGGAWKKANKLHVRVGGAWKEVKKGYVRVGGVWKLVFSAGVESLLTYGVNGFGTERGYRAWGVSGTHYGSLSVTLVNGHTVNELSTSNPAGQIRIRMVGTGIAQDAFSGISCSVGEFLTSSATYSSNDGNGNSTWTWSAGSNFPASGSETVRFLT